MRPTPHPRDGRSPLRRRLLPRLGGQDIAIDLGTANTLVFVRGEGIVASEPSVVAIDTDQRRGARGRRGGAADDRPHAGPDPAVRPLRHGVIADFEVTEQMLRHFMARVHRSRLARPRVMMCAPSGITDVERRALIGGVHRGRGALGAPDRGVAGGGDRRRARDRRAAREHGRRRGRRHQRGRGDLARRDRGVALAAHRRLRPRRDRGRLAAQHPRPGDRRDHRRAREARGRQRGARPQRRRSPRSRAGTRSRASRARSRSRARRCARRSRTGARRSSSR